MAEPGSAQSVGRKIAVTGLVGLISFPFTQLLFPSLVGQVAAAAVFSSIVLVIQFLMDFERRLAKVETRLVTCVDDIRQVVDQGFAKVNHATALVSKIEMAGLHSVAVTELIEHAAGIGPTAPVLVRAFVRMEVQRVSELLRGLTAREATYDGEDQEWLLNLTRCAERTIDAISIPEVDAAGNKQQSFWQSALGRRYLGLQREAVRRGVRVRRVFVTERDEMANDPDLQRLCRVQADSGIEVRLLNPSSVPVEIEGQITDVILFDDELIYETTPGPHLSPGEVPMIHSSRLQLEPKKIAYRTAQYKYIWAAAVPAIGGAPDRSVAAHRATGNAHDPLEEGGIFE